MTVSSGVPPAGSSHFRLAAGTVSAGPVVVELSASQVEKVVRAASDGRSMAMLFSGLADVRAILAGERGPLEDARLSRSLLILVLLPQGGSYVKLGELARMGGTSPSTTHRYLSTLVAVGLAEQDPGTRHYRRVHAG
jgi:IclR-like helix-turn-helix domain-containing protein